MILLLVIFVRCLLCFSVYKITESIREENNLDATPVDVLISVSKFPSAADSIKLTEFNIAEAPNRILKMLEHQIEESINNAVNAGRYNVTINYPTSFSDTEQFKRLELELVSLGYSLEKERHHFILSWK